MNGITHKQATELTRRRLDGLLSEGDSLLLDEHLHSCDSCRIHAEEMELLSARLQSEFQLRWDQKPGPSHNLIEHVTAKARRIPMANRVSSSAKLFAGIAALGILAIALNFIIPGIRDTGASPTTNSPAPAPLTIDPQSCMSFPDSGSDLQPPNQLYGYEPIQGTSFVDGDFSYEFWLYCDPSLRPDDKENFSAIAGLGIYASLDYTGPTIDGPVEYYYEFEPNNPLGGGSWNGPLYNASITGARFGIDISETKVREYIQQGTPVQFRVRVDSALGQNGAILSFNLEPTEQGYKIADLHADQLDHPSAGLIAFTSAIENGNLDIYTMRPDGNELTNLTNNPAHDVNPFWSPDGRRIAFESDRDGFMHIYLMDPDGSNVIQLTEDEADHEIGTKYGIHSSPWSPDGSKLIFSQRAVGKWILYTMDANGENPKPLVTEPNIYSYPAWSPNGQHIAFLASDATEPNGPRLYVVDADGNNLTEVTKSLPENERLWAYIGYYWSRDGQSIFFIAYRQIDEGQDQWIAYEFSLEGNTLGEKAVSSTPMGDWWEGTSFITGFGDIKSPLTWLRSDGTFSTLEPLEKCQMGDENQYGATYARSAHGNLVIAARCPIGDWWLYWANPNGTEIKSLLDAPIAAKGSDIMGLIWSPDDRYLAINMTMDGKTYMSILNIEEALKDPSVKLVQTVIGGGSLFYDPSWQPMP